MTPCRSNNSTSPLPSPLHSCLAEAPMQLTIWAGEAGQEQEQEEKLKLPVPSREHDALNRYFLHRTNYHVNALQNMVETNKPPLIEDQRTGYEVVMNLIAEKKSDFFFLEAPGGTEKSFLIHFIQAEILSKLNLALAVASSGIATTLNGCTAYSHL
ncbi:hypothetical protein AVEN_171064-1 [Araneus ventricosus]|uniref:ATP-dependent DNA helicase n=1 Tax=Araneus ventricosus TaxID=182803 RepID=A0A4Y2MV62_ARAVE|nr:hypothetical protein AVEN_171064-1 [Araneus ventricosus]